MAGADGKRKGFLTADDCLICERVALARAGENPYLIAEFPHTVFVVGDHQYHRGYSLLLLKEHVRELHEIAPDVQTAMFHELMTATRALVKTFAPHKMNHECLGNADAHVHWHIFPRYADDPDARFPPFKNYMHFSEHVIDAAAAREIAARVRGNLA